MIDDDAREFKASSGTDFIQSFDTFGCTSGESGNGRTRGYQLVAQMHRNWSPDSLVGGDGERPFYPFTDVSAQK